MSDSVVIAAHVDTREARVRESAVKDPISAKIKSTVKNSRM